jgi:TM2 domain-containing membrane protein YozV
MALGTAELSLIEQRVANDGPSTGVAYLMWFFLGLFSAHRFYLGTPGTAVVQFLTYFILICFIWLIVDAFLIPSMVRAKKDAMREKLKKSLLAQSGAGDGGQSIAGS